MEKTVEGIVDKDEYYKGFLAVLSKGIMATLNELKDEKHTDDVLYWERYIEPAIEKRLRR